MKKIYLKMMVIVCVCGMACLSYQFRRPMISVIMPNYNKGSLLPRAIESILKQTFTDFEFLIYDDGSTDDSVKIIQSYAEKDSRIRFFRGNKNRGISYGRNKLFDLARGKYLALMDSDDISKPQRLFREVYYMETHPDITVVGTWMDYTNGVNLFDFKHQPEEVGIKMIFGCAIPDGSSMIRSSFIREHQLRYNNHILAGMDYLLWADILVEGGKFSILTDNLYSHYSHRSHKPQYYHDQQWATQRAQNLMQGLFFKLTPENKRLDYCGKLKLIRKGNRKVKLFDNNVLSKMIKRDCLKKNTSSDKVE